MKRLGAIVGGVSVAVALVISFGSDAIGSQVDSTVTTSDGLTFAVPPEGTSAADFPIDGATALETATGMAPVGSTPATVRFAIFSDGHFRSVTKSGDTAGPLLLQDRPAWLVQLPGRCIDASGGGAPYAMDQSQVNPQCVMGTYNFVIDAKTGSVLEMDATNDPTYP